MRIHELADGEYGRVVGYEPEADEPYRAKLLRMGLVRGAIFRVIRRAPLGDPIQLCATHTSLTVRRREASVLRIERVLASHETELPCLSCRGHRWRAGRL